MSGGPVGIPEFTPTFWTGVVAGVDFQYDILSLTWTTTHYGAIATSEWLASEASKGLTSAAPVRKLKYGHLLRLPLIRG